MRRIALSLALSLSALLAGSSLAVATDTEADAIKAVVDAWIKDDDGEAALVALDALYTDTTADACKQYADMLFTTVSLISAGTEFSPENKLGTTIGYAVLIQNIEAMEYACRIAQ